MQKAPLEHQLRYNLPKLSPFGLSPCSSSASLLRPRFSLRAQLILGHKPHPPAANFAFPAPARSEFRTSASTSNILGDAGEGAKFINLGAIAQRTGGKRCVLCGNICRVVTIHFELLKTHQEQTK